MMRAALALARRAVGTTAENPPVGCVIARDGVVLGRGFTQPGGRPHAERIALAQAGEAARGADVYVTLEPCAHFGQTPPCAAALIESGVARVVSALRDPDPRVDGGGLAMLRAAGIAVETGLMAEEAREIAAGFLSRIERGRPFLTLKLATTLDGRIATQSGESRWISGPAARARVHVLRAQSDAIMVGAATAVADDPALTVRLPGLEDRAPIPVILEGAAPLPNGLRLLGDPRLIRLPRGDLAAGLRELGARGINRLLCEGGGRLAAALLRAGLVDELIWVCAGAAIGADGAPALAEMGVTALADAPRFELLRAERLGCDLLTIWRPTLAAPGPAA